MSSKVRELIMKFMREKKREQNTNTNTKSEEMKIQQKRRAATAGPWGTTATASYPANPTV